MKNKKTLFIESLRMQHFLQRVLFNRIPRKINMRLNKMLHLREHDLQFSESVTKQGRLVFRDRKKKHKFQLYKLAQVSLLGELPSSWKMKWCRKHSIDINTVVRSTPAATGINHSVPRIFKIRLNKMFHVREHQFESSESIINQI